ncbi:hypothetical protein [Agromyces bauzanensis]
MNPNGPGTHLDPATLAALREAVAALPDDELRDPARVPELALLTTVPDAAKAFPVVRDTALRSELAARGIRATDTRSEGRPAHRGRTGWTIAALILALAAPALILTGRGGGAAFDVETGALPSGIGMVVALLMFAWLEPSRTRGLLYRGGSVGGSTFVFYAVLWLAVAVFAIAGGAVSAPAGAIGVALQLIASVGAGVLAVVALRRDRARPQVLGGRAAPSALEVPAELAASPEFRAGVERRLGDWRQHTETVLTAEERGRVRAAELEVVRLVAERVDGPA